MKATTAIKHIFLSVALGLIVFGFYVAYYVGAFKGVDVSYEQRGPINLIFKIHRGPYHKIVSTIEEVENWAKDMKIPCEKSFGRYLDNPDLVEQSRLKSQGGCVVDEIPQNLPEGYESLSLPAQEYIIATFDGSPGIGPMKVYPKAYDYADEKQIELATPVIEIYKITGKNEMHTEYLFETKTPKNSKDSPNK